MATLGFLHQPSLLACRTTETTGMKIKNIAPFLIFSIAFVSPLSFSTHAQTPAPEPDTTIVLRCVITRDITTRGESTVGNFIFLKWNGTALLEWENGGWNLDTSDGVRFEASPIHFAHIRRYGSGVNRASLMRNVDRRSGIFTEMDIDGGVKLRDRAGTCTPSAEPPGPAVPATKF